MTRRSFNNSTLENLKTKRKNYTIAKNNYVEPFKHGAVIISRKGKGAVISYGANTYNINYGSKHAEEMAFTNAKRFLQSRKSKNLSNMKRRIKVDIVVLRTTGNNSRPCNHCITTQLSNNRLFNVRKVIYSDGDVEGGYITTSTNKLYENKNAHYSGFYAKLNNISNCCNNNNGFDDEMDEENNDDEDEGLPNKSFKLKNR
jgi:cytidine deaminase